MTESYSNSAGVCLISQAFISAAREKTTRCKLQLFI